MYIVGCYSSLEDGTAYFKIFFGQTFFHLLYLFFYKVSCEGPRQVRRKFQSAKKLHIFKCLNHLAFLIFVHRFFVACLYICTNPVSTVGY